VLTLPAIRWGKPYTSLEKQEVVHFLSGEPIANISQVNGGMLQLDMKKAAKARAVLREIPSDDLLSMCETAAELVESAELPMGDGTETVDDCIHPPSARTARPGHTSPGKT